ncbi:hypothetical protein M0M43_30470 (plasmid) [Pimelobacter simplex]|nr:MULTISPECIES: SCO6880 family protein [Pimelobacter]UUW93020.1 hypothetical protein M0M43_30470 [Pimelobacter simplex]UUW99053.1 hypothetical protein M0M48_30490 [Pimelobacter simplex]
MALIFAAVVLVGIIAAGMVAGWGLWGLGLGVGWTVLSLAAVLPEAIKTRDGQGRYTKAVAGVRFGRGERSGETLLSQGLTGKVPDGKIALPGVAATLGLQECHDIHGNAFGLLTWGETNLYSVVINTNPSGISGKDPETFDAEVAQWGAWMGQLNKVGNIVAAQVTVESAPDSGQRLARAIDRGRAENADEVPAFSATMAEQIKASASLGSPQVITRVTITFSGEERNDETGEVLVRSAEEMRQQIGDLLPELVSTLVATGAGSKCRAAQAQQIVDFTRVAFDPSVAPRVEEAQLAGGTGLTWDESGPLTAVNRFDHYQHETAFSRTWQMREAPKGSFFGTVLQRLLAPHRDIVRKRVTLCYRTESPLKSADIADNDVRAASIAYSGSPRAKEAQRQAVMTARRTAEQEALGSPLIRVGLLVTVTVLDRDLLDRVSQMVTTRLAPQARLRMRLPRGAQDSAFIAALPLGMVPHRHAGLAAFADQV